MERSLSMELVRVTEAAALKSARWMGRGVKAEADDAATMAMRTVFDTIPMQGTVVIGEGEMDEAPICILVKSWEPVMGLESMLLLTP